jgi:hypothetical protein
MVKVKSAILGRPGRRWLFLRDRLAAAITPLDDPAAWEPRNRA